MTIRHLLTANEVAEILQISPRTLASWRTKYPDELPFVRVGGRSIRYRPDVVEDFVDSQEFDDSDEDFDECDD